jgi:hypothetical protein
VHTPWGEVLFYKDEQGLPYIDLEGSDQDAVMMLVQEQVGMKEFNKGKGMSLVQMVRGNYKGYTKKEVLQAKEVQRAQAMLGNPSEKDFKGMLSSNIIPTCPITRSNVTNARKIFGPDLASVHGKTVHWTPAPVVGDYVAIPREIVEANAAVTLAADVFFVDGTAFLMTVSRKVKFVMVEHVPMRMAKCLCKHLERVLLMYGRASFRVRTILMDGELEKIKNFMATVECNTTAAKEHVSKAERTIQMINEQTRGLITALPFRYIPRRMKIEFIYFKVLRLNTFLVKTGVSATYLLRKLLVRWWLP